MKNVSIKPLATFRNENVKFFVAKVDNPENEFEYVMVAFQGELNRITLGGTKEQMLRFFENGLEALKK